MPFVKTAAISALIAAAALSTSMTAASAHSGKGMSNGMGMGMGNNMKFHNKHHFNSFIVIGAQPIDCSVFLRRYYKTGNPIFKKQYYACIY